MASSEIKPNALYSALGTFAKLTTESYGVRSTKISAFGIH